MPNLSGSTQAVFRVSLSSPVAYPIAVAWQTQDGTAVAGTDYRAAVGTLNFQPGETVKEVSVLVYGRDSGDIAVREFSINLSPPAGAVLRAAQIRCQISAGSDASLTVVILTVPNGPRGLAGPTGMSAYQQAVALGFEGTASEWLDSLVGETGEEGPRGPVGKSAYEMAVDNGFEGTEQDWLDVVMNVNFPLNLGPLSARRTLALAAGTTAQTSAFTGVMGELNYDSQLKRLIAHDGVTPGGIPLARQDQVRRVVDTIAQLRALPKGLYSRVFVLGYKAAGDGGGGDYIQLAATGGAAAEDGGIHIAGDDDAHWILIGQCKYSICQFGILTGNTRAQNTEAFNNLLAKHWYFDSVTSIKLTAPAGIFLFDKGISKPPSFLGVNLEGAGKGVTTFDFTQQTGDASVAAWLFTGGSGRLTYSVVSGITFVGTAGYNLIEFDGQGGQKFRECFFVICRAAGLFHNKSPGSFSEFNTFDSCEFGDQVEWALEYRRTAGNDSFHGSGTLGNCVIGHTVGQVGRIKIGTGCHPYNAPMNAQFFVVGNTTIFVHDEAGRSSKFVGNITLETFAGQATLAFGYDVAFSGSLQFLGRAPVWGSFFTAPIVTGAVDGIAYVAGATYVSQKTLLEVGVPKKIYIPTALRGTRLIQIFYGGTFMGASYLYISACSQFGSPTIGTLGKSARDEGGMSGIPPTVALNADGTSIDITQLSGPSTDIKAYIVVSQIGQSEFSWVHAD